MIEAPRSRIAVATLHRMTRAAGPQLAALLAAVTAGCAGPLPLPPPSVPSATPHAGPATSASATEGVATEGVAAEWRLLDDAPFARLEMAVASHRGRIWLAGGLAPQGDALAEVDVFDPASGTWSEGPALPAPVHHAALVSDGERLVLVGGYLGSAFNRPTDIVLTLADGDDAWREGVALPEPRAAGAAAWDGSRIVYAGGMAEDVRREVYALEGSTWEPIGQLAAAREHLAAASDGNGRTWLLGGRVGDLDSNLATVELIEGDAITEQPELPTARGGAAAFFAPGVGACLTGGEAPDRAHTVVECIAADDTVAVLADLVQPHHGHGTAVVDGVAYVLLGGPEPLLTAGTTVEALDLASLAP